MPTPQAGKTVICTLEWPTFSPGSCESVLSATERWRLPQPSAEMRTGSIRPASRANGREKARRWRGQAPFEVTAFSWRFLLSLPAFLLKRCAVCRWLRCGSAVRRLHLHIVMSFLHQLQQLRRCVAAFCGFFGCLVATSHMRNDAQKREQQQLATNFSSYSPASQLHYRIAA